MSAFSRLSVVQLFDAILFFVRTIFRLDRSSKRPARLIGYPEKASEQPPVWLSTANSPAQDDGFYPEHHEHNQTAYDLAHHLFPLLKACRSQSQVGPVTPGAA